MITIPENNKTRSQFDAHIGMYISFADYLSSYRFAFESLMETVYKFNRPVDMAAYPLLFIARHCIELGFKTNIQYFRKYSEDEYLKTMATHNLEQLFKAFKLHVANTIKNLKIKYDIEVEEEVIDEYNKYCNEVEKLTTIFHLLDKNSEAFRYPVNKKDNAVFKYTEIINVLDIKKLYEKSMMLLTHTTDLFADYINMADYVEDIYEQDLQKVGRKINGYDFASLP